MNCLGMTVLQGWKLPVLYGYQVLSIRMTLQHRLCLRVLTNHVQGVLGVTCSF